MTSPQFPNNSSNGNIASRISSFDEIAIHLSKQISPAQADTDSKNNSPGLPEYLDRTTHAQTGSVQRISEPVQLVRKIQELRTIHELSSPPSQCDSATERGPVHHRERFSGDPCDDVRLQWADDIQTWWHFDVEARMVDRETLWIMEKFEELFLKYLKPVWWDRFVEGISDFLVMIYKELVHPIWSFVVAPFAALAQWIPEIEWPWNFELRGANVSVKQSPFRRMVFDSSLASQVVERLWNEPDEYLDAGQNIAKDDFGAAARVPIKPPTTSGHFSHSSVGLLKRFNLRGITHTLARLLLFTRGSRSWTYGREFLAAGINTARPLAMVEDRLGPFRFRSFVLTEHIEGTPLPDFLAKTPLNTLELDRIAGQFARIWHTLGELRIVHGAMHASNFLVTADRRLVLIGLDGTWRHWFDLTYLHRRDRDWLRFMKAWRGQPEISAAFRAAVGRYFEEKVAIYQTATPHPALQLQRAA